jgi:glycosyltransferase involved in cell wall biosynthesis
MEGGIVFINQATGYITIDIINEFTGKFKDIVLITGSVRIQDTNLVSRVKIEYITRYDRGNNFRKALSWIKGSVQIFYLLKFRYRGYDKFYFTVPPIASLMAPWFKGRYSVLVFDLYPEALMANGFTEKNFVYRLWAKRNIRIFQKCFKIFTISEGLKTGIGRYIFNKEIIVIPNWSAFSHFVPVRKEENQILKREGLFNRFIVQYSGNIGVTHNVETLVDIAENLTEENDILFQIIGRGERSIEIARSISEKKLTNCVLQPFREDAELYESLCAADVAVIILDDSIPDISIPSKIYNVMSAGLPVMAIASVNSGLAYLVARHNLGEIFEKDDIKGMSRFILDLKFDNDKRNEYALNSLRASALFTKDNAQQYLQSYLA